MLSQDQAQHLSKMVSFRNVAVHDYQSLEIEIVESIVTTRLVDLEAFAAILIRAAERLTQGS